MLLGSGAHWVLLTDPGDEQVVQEIWDVLSMTAPSGSTVVEQVLAIVEKAFDGDPPGLALVDFTVGCVHVALARRRPRAPRRPGRVLSLDGGADPDDLPATRRLVGGVVGAARRRAQADLRHATAPAPHAQAADGAAPPPAAMIDGIPAAILAAKGPDGPPPRTRRRADRWRTPGSLHRHLRARPAADGAHRGGHPHHDPAAPSEPHRAPRGRGVDDHDGSTTHRPAHLAQQHRTPTVLAVSCPLGHLTPPVAPAVPGVPPAGRPAGAAPGATAPRSAGCACPPARSCRSTAGVILGRKPAPAEGSTDWPHLVHLPSDHSFVSRRHLQIELDGWDVVARDLDSRGGTTLTLPGRDPQRMRPGDAYVLEPGTSSTWPRSTPSASRSGGGCPVSAPVIPGFAFVEHLGSGGFADVFLYEQQWPRQRVAVKVVRPDVPLTDREKYLFTAEANAMARLADHPYIVSVITAGVTAEGGRPFLVMRYCPPPDLGVRVRSNPMAPVDAVAHRHQAGQRHRDRPPLRASCTATSSRATSWSRPTTSRRSPTSASPATWPTSRATTTSASPTRGRRPSCSTAGPTARSPPTSTPSAPPSGTCSSAARPSRSRRATTRRAR